MTFILRAQLDADVKTALSLYQKYIDHNKRYFPESVLALLEHPDWQNGGNFSRYPHDGHLKDFSAFSDNGEENIKLIISKPQADVEIQIKYSNVIDFDFPSFGSGLKGFGRWAYDQFKFYNPYHDYGIKETKMFQHEIEWLGGVIWTVTAAEIEVVWKDV